MKNFSDLLTYEFNLQNKAGLKAYHHFLKGDLLKAREIYLKSKGLDAFKGKREHTSAVKMIRKTNSYSEDAYVSGGIAIPILISAKRKSGKSFELSSFQELRKNIVGKNYVGVFKEKSQTTGFLSKNSHRLVMFAGKFQEISKMEAGEKRTLNDRFAANYKYEYHRDKFDQVKFFEELHKQAHRIGFTKIC